MAAFRQLPRTDTTSGSAVRSLATDERGYTRISPVVYDGIVVGDFVADMLVERSVLVEIKAVKALDNVHMAQCLNYLRATGLTVCVLFNFGEPKLAMKRVVFNPNSGGRNHG